MSFNEQLLLSFLPGQTVRDSVPRQLARLSDPSTSKQAAEKLCKSGKLRGIKKAVLKDLSENDGSTSGEIGMRLSDDRYYASRRMAELERAGLVVRGKIRLCTACSNKSLTWWLTPEGRAKAKQISTESKDGKTVYGDRKVG